MLCEQKLGGASAPSPPIAYTHDYRYVCGRGLFSGDAAHAASTRKQCLLAQLLNTFGL